MKFLITAALVGLLLTGCGKNGPATTALNGCDWTAYILVGKGDVLTEATAGDILAHNLQRQRHCEAP